MGRVKGTDEGKVHSEAGISGTQVSAETGYRERPPWQGLRTWGRTAPAWGAGVQRREGSYREPHRKPTAGLVASLQVGLRGTRHRWGWGRWRSGGSKGGRATSCPHLQGWVGRSGPWCCSVFSSDPDCG